jgi:hypothetical protein
MMQMKAKQAKKLEEEAALDEVFLLLLPLQP